MLPPVKCRFQHILFHHDLDLDLLTPKCEMFISVPQWIVDESLEEICQIRFKISCLRFGTYAQMDTWMYGQQDNNVMHA